MTAVLSEQQRWNERFAAPGHVFGATPNAFLARQAHRLKPGQSVLAVADGQGRNGVWLAKQGLKVTSFDFAPNGVARAKELAKEHGVTVDMRLADIEAWPWTPEAFDVVAAIFIQFAPPPMRAQIFAGLKRTLKRGGLLILEGYRPKQVEYKTGGPPHAEHMYTRELLEAAFGDMEILHLAEYDADIEEGAGHKGISALIDLVARKRS
jgi:SAM-dependent methyltransferase